MAVNWNWVRRPPGATSHVIDIASDAGPQRYQPGSANQRQPAGYCSVAKLKAPMMRFAAQYRRPEGAPEWLGQCPASKAQVETAIQILMAHWGGPPPKRGRARSAHHTDDACDARLRPGAAHDRGSTLRPHGPLP